MKTITEKDIENKLKEILTLHLEYIALLPLDKKDKDTLIHILEFWIKNSK